MALPIKKAAATKPMMATQKVQGNNDDLVANHLDEFTVRSLWSSLTRPDVPAGHFGIQVKREKTGESKFLLISVEDFQKKVHPPVMMIADITVYKDWHRK